MQQQPDCTAPGQWTYCPGCSTAMPAAELARKGICDECKARETAHEQQHDDMVAAREMEEAERIEREEEERNTDHHEEER